MKAYHFDGTQAEPYDTERKVFGVDYVRVQNGRGVACRCSPGDWPAPGAEFQIIDIQIGLNFNVWDVGTEFEDRTYLYRVEPVLLITKTNKGENVVSTRVGIKRIRKEKTGRGDVAVFVGIWEAIRWKPVRAVSGTKYYTTLSSC